MNIPRSPLPARAGLRSRVRGSVRARRLASLAGATGIAAAAVLAVPGTATAHGVAMVPGSRTYLCYKDLLANSSTQMPSNPACKAAVQEAGTTALYNWFAVLDSNAGGRGEGYVEDGNCWAGRTWRTCRPYRTRHRRAVLAARRTSSPARTWSSTEATARSPD